MVYRPQFFSALDPTTYNKLSMNTNVISEIKRRLAALSEEQRTILESKIRHLSAGKKSSVEIAPRAVTSKYPLTFAQKRMWIMQQLAIDGAACNRPLAIRLRGSIDWHTIERALNDIIQRHEVLRTYFPLLDSMPSPVILAQYPLPFEVIDLRATKHSEPDLKLRETMNDIACQPLDLAASPSIRAYRISLAVNDEVLFILLHHIAFDGWSSAVMLNELTMLYNAYLRQAPNPLKELTLQYDAYANWEQGFMRSRQARSELDYWRRQLLDAPLTTEIPRDYSGAGSSFRGGLIQTQVPRECRDNLISLCRQQEVTLSMVCLAALKILIFHHTGQHDLLIGVLSSGRDKVEWEPLIGVFINTLPIRSKLSGEMTSSEFVQQIKNTCLNANAHQQLPIDHIIDHLPRRSDKRRAEFFQTIFNFHNLPDGAGKFGDARGELIASDAVVTPVDLNFELKNRAGEWTFLVSYNANCYRQSTIERFALQYVKLLTVISDNPGEPVSILLRKTLNCIDPHNHDRHSSLSESGQYLLVHELIARAAVKTPDAVAIVDADQHLTYGELDRCSHVVAASLGSLGVGLEDPVGIYMDRSPEQIIAMIGILISGGAYLPLNIDDPPERLIAIIKNTGLSLLIVDRNSYSRLPAAGSCLIIRFADLARGSLSLTSDRSPAHTVHGDNLAYLISTSGSAGHPKAVMISHHALSVYSQSAAEFYLITKQDRVLQFSALTFDASVEEIYPTLIQGATLVLRPADILNSVSHLLMTCRRYDITILDLPTAYWHFLIDEASAWEYPFPSSTRLLIIGGEMALATKWLRWRNLVRPTPLVINTYGPTETTVVSMAYILQPDFKPDAISLPLGKAMPHAKIGLIDEQLRPSIAGLPGEIVIGGAGVARGYWWRADLTADRFIPDHFSAIAGARSFRTGDLGCDPGNGIITFHSRQDHQIKLRGYRVELGEIEMVLGQHPAIEQVIVTPYEDGTGNNSLAAYVVMRKAEDYRLKEEEEMTDEGKYRITNSQSQIIGKSANLKDGRMEEKGRVERETVNRELLMVNVKGEAKGNGKTEEEMTALNGLNTLAQDKR